MSWADETLENRPSVRQKNNHKELTEQIKQIKQGFYLPRAKRTEDDSWIKTRKFKIQSAYGGEVNHIRRMKVDKVKNSFAKWSENDINRTNDKLCCEVLWHMIYCSDKREILNFGINII